MQPHPKRKLIIWILGSLATVSPFAIDLYLPAFSEIAKDFNTEPAKISLSISSYFIGMAIGQITYGPLLDRYGRKPPLYAGLSLFIIASIACTQANSVESLVAMRFIQALGGSVAWVAGLAMVRDFFPVTESARIFSLLILILGVSPLLAPTLGGFITTALGWEAIFLALAIIGAAILLITVFLLPVGHQADRRVSLKPKPILLTFVSILKHPQFYTYCFAGAFSAATLFIYVAGSPVVFMEIFDVSPRMYGGIFALLSVSFIGANQLNILLTRKYSSEKLFSVALTCQLVTSIIFLIGGWNGWFGLAGTIAMFFIALGCLGFCSPNGNALALAPLTRNIGSASALLACSQIGVAALASSGVAIFDTRDLTPVAGLMAGTCSIAWIIHWRGKAKIGTNLAEASEAGHAASL